MLQHFLKLDALLTENMSLWRVEPFHLSYHGQCAWQQKYPELHDWLLALSPEEAQRYKASTPALLAALSKLSPLSDKIANLTSLPTAEIKEIQLLKGLDTGIPGRKLQQIVSMGSFALAHQQANQWVEWCAGKGYLGRVLASNSKQKVVSFEWQPQLCESGQKEADKLNLAMEFVQGDALSENARDIIKVDQHLVALHACGDLHIRLMQHGSSVGSKGITLSPCCYHLIETTQYQPLSNAASSSVLNLDRSDLRIPLQETVTGGQRTVRHREQEMGYRLGLDSLLRQELGMSGYVAIPSIRKSELANGFSQFCLWATSTKGIALPQVDFDYWEEEGKKRFWLMERLSLTQQLFRRVLELWLVFDRALYLQERGYTVSVSEFCAREVTPRNIIIHAER